MGLVIQKEQDEYRLLAKDQPVNANWWVDIRTGLLSDDPIQILVKLAWIACVFDWLPRVILETKLTLTKLACSRCSDSGATWNGL